MSIGGGTSYARQHPGRLASTRPGARRCRLAYRRAAPCPGQHNARLLPPTAASSIPWSASGFARASASSRSVSCPPQKPWSRPAATPQCATSKIRTVSSGYGPAQGAKRSVHGRGDFGSSGALEPLPTTRRHLPQPPRADVLSIPVQGSARVPSQHRHYNSRSSGWARC